VAFEQHSYGLPPYAWNQLAPDRLFGRQPYGPACPPLRRRRAGHRDDALPLFPIQRRPSSPCDEFLNASWFRTLNDVRVYSLTVWPEEYNCERPHNSLDYCTPQEVTIALEGSPAMAASLRQPQS